MGYTFFRFPCASHLWMQGRGCVVSFLAFTFIQTCLCHPRIEVIIYWFPLWRISYRRCRRFVTHHITKRMGRRKPFSSRARHSESFVQRVSGRSCNPESIGRFAPGVKPSSKAIKLQNPQFFSKPFISPRGSVLIYSIRSRAYDKGPQANCFFPSFIEQLSLAR